MELDNIVGNLRAYNQLEQGTFRHGDQLMDERQTDHELRDQWFYTADGNGYFPVENDVEWAITREAENLVLRHLDDEVNSSYDQLVQTGNFRPDNAEAQAAKDAEDTIVVKMGKLRLSGDDRKCGREWRYLAIRTKDGFVRKGKKYVKPNEEEQKVMDKFGYNSENLEMLHNSIQKITETKIYVPNPDYVRGEVAKDSEHNSLWRASRLNIFSCNSNFYAVDCNVDSRCRLRGVRREVAVGAAEKNDEVPHRLHRK